MITVVDYKAGNLTSVKLALEYIGEDVLITDRPADILAASRVVFPGVGAAKAAMGNLERLGLVEPIRKVVEKGVPFFGICIGIQLLFESSEENGGTKCMGLLPGAVKRFRPVDKMCKIPQIGWNAVKLATENTEINTTGWKPVPQKKKHPLFEGIEDQSEFYFVHSYYPCAADESMVIGTTDYADVTFTSAAARGNLAAVQFHPEKSGRIGLQVLKNFCKWEGQEK